MKLVVLALALVMSAGACKKASQEPPRADETVSPAATTAPTNVAPGPGVRSANSADAATSTGTPEFVPPLAPSPQELEANRAAAEEYYRSPQGASGSAGGPTGPR